MHPDIVGPCRLGCVREGDEMLLMAVDPAVRNKSDEVEPVAARLGEGFLEDRIGGEVAVADRFVNAGEVLVNDAARAQIEVSDLGIAHLAPGQPDVFTARTDVAVRVCREHLLMERS